MFKNPVRPISYWAVCSAAVGIQAFVATLLINQFLKIDFSALDYSSKALFPFFVLVLIAVVPRKTRDGIAHFRLKEPLPGCRAFSKYAREDYRISIDVLKATVGKFPKKSIEQNALWYQLYQKQKSAAEVIAAHKKYLLFRDLSIIQIIAFVFWLLAALVTGINALYGICLLNLFFYGLFVIATNNSGASFVQTVLALSQNKPDPLHP